MKQQSGHDISYGEKKGHRVASVAFPNAAPGVYDYYIPERLSGSISPGTPVLVSLRNRRIWGVAVDVKTASSFPELKELIEIQHGRWIDEGGSLIKLYRWVADYYQCDLGRVFRPLMSKGLSHAPAKTIRMFTPNPDPPKGKLSKKYCEIWEKLRTLAAFSAEEAKERFDIPRSAINRLLARNYLLCSDRVVMREALELRAGIMTKGSVELTAEQRAAVDAVMRAYDEPREPFLLYGITGSGKTHVYMELASRVLSCGKGVIILVPEIALTPQTIQKFKGALGDVLTVIHSHMSYGERRDSLQELVTGTKRVVIGVRSAIMAPMDRVGLIIVDEEHDGSYKQSDCDPRYHARDVAVMRGLFQKALVVLGSATPAFETYHNAMIGKYRLLCLSQRFGKGALPMVEIVDMRDERRNNNWKPLSNRLAEAIASTLSSGRQTILLLNRRGFSTLLLCKDCGYTAHCPECSVTLRYHRADTTLKCHLCGYTQTAPECCPGCGGYNIKYKGTGVQKVEEILRETFTSARILRMDLDSTRRKGAHATILGKFAHGEADILLGTQMVAKGLDFPGVSLVGVIAADTGLHLPDFRAAERTFQLLTQVAGRAGRCDSIGKVIIQTYCPDESAVRFAASHDYVSFYEHESQSRKTLGYPPWGRLARIIVIGRVEKEVKGLIAKIAREIRSLKDNAITVLGPAPAVLERISRQSRYTILLKSPSPKQIQTALKRVRGIHSRLPSSLKLVIDVDPVNML